MYMYISCNFVSLMCKLISNLKFQGTLVPKLTLGPFLTLTVRNGPKLRVKVDSKNYNQQINKHHKDNNSEF